MAKIILTGFGKFGNILVNPTTKLATQLKDDPNVHESLVLEVSAEGVRETLAPMWKEAVNGEETIVFVHLGVNDGSEKIHLEQVGYNIANFRLPDERGYVAQNEVIETEEEESLHSHLPLEKYLTICQEQGIKMALSTDPGRYICNYTYFLSLFHAKKRADNNMHALFVHVPQFTVINEDEQLHAIKTLLGLIAEL